MSIIEEELNKSENRHYAKRYMRFVEYIKMRPLPSVAYTENHHILPRSVFPEYADERQFDWNILTVTGREHFLCHWMLAKIYEGNQWFSFNQMRRVGNRSILFEYARQKISKQLSIINSGQWAADDPRRAEMSKRNIGMINTIDPREPNIIIRVSNMDSRYLSGELISVRTGSIHREETKEKMRQNGLRNRRMFTDGGKHIFCHSLEEGYVRGLQLGSTQLHKDKARVRVANSIWVTEMKTGKCRRISEIDFDPLLHEKGRIGFAGFAYINNNRNKIPHFAKQKGIQLNG